MPWQVHRSRAGKSSTGVTNVGAGTNAVEEEGHVVGHHEAGDGRRPVVVCRREWCKHGKRPQQEAGELEAAPPEDVD